MEQSFSFDFILELGQQMLQVHETERGHTSSVGEKHIWLLRE
jgi:hypothetical protein